MNTRYCSICSTAFDLEIEGDEGTIGMIPFAFCATCKSGVFQYVMESDIHDKVWEDMNL